MKKTIIITFALSTSFVGFAQQPQQKPTLTKKEQATQAVVKEYGVRVQNEENQIATDMLLKLKDTSISKSDRKIYIDSYRHSVRNGNPSVKKKSYDLTTQENYTELITLSKSSKFNKQTQVVCLDMSNAWLPPGEYKNRLTNKLKDTTLSVSERTQRINDYVQLCASSDENIQPSEKEISDELLFMSTSPKFNKQTQALCSEMYNKSK
jgi:hypothetical protein